MLGEAAATVAMSEAAMAAVPVVVEVATTVATAEAVVADTEEIQAVATAAALEVVAVAWTAAPAPVWVVVEAAAMVEFHPRIRRPRRQNTAATWKKRRFNTSPKRKRL